jgi:hypothetical protein
MMSSVLQRCLLASVVTWGTLWTSAALAQSSSPILNPSKSTDILDSNAQDFNPLSLINKINLSKEDPFTFFQRQQENLNTEVSDFLSRQRQQLQQQGYNSLHGTPDAVTVKGNVPATPDASNVVPASTGNPASNPAGASNLNNTAPVLQLQLPATDTPQP